MGGPAVPAPNTPGRGAPPRPILLQPGPALPRQQTADRIVNALQEGARTSTNVARADPMGARNLIENVALSSGANLVPHGLGRAFRSAHLAGPSAAVTYAIRRPSGIAQDATHVQITVSATCIADLVVW
jgi:hypothetical protein